MLTHREYRTGGQFGAQRILCKVVNYGNGSQFGAQGSKTNLAYEESSSSDTETEIDELDPYLLDFSSEIYNRISEQACKTLKQTALLSQSYHKSCIPFLLQMSKRPKKTTFSIELQTFSRSKTIIVTDGDSTKKIVLLICFHPHDPTNPLFNGLTELIEDIYTMSTLLRY
ncbi:hypothetical protein KEM48_012149 [Puccinia striiformis f. sp. tritici PST-130]|uniref:Uncharacterized protein n=2 Tax=Puccinia striiformis TaxID=27350 RepID=A0A0L0W1Q1_9BASI|nr:hypothetical protein Pst134EB_029657 [Puccinia striiformis f. sp. tritici]KAI9617308.1 hypothetical protein H4Q26_013177 [Puccinia striiformis f. sp. tritici PST-130]KNF05434.1 hypothetical protein PSTG_01243 [Puccinia striiformis f. sp. tritici PST-78]POW12875.1 hypothetical protein PSTT_04195 [Puccinia striiformis]KAI9623358.1 hypothetical protein H4Q26_014523 [Puccinia striiformis f. sp. tritici PST-130]